ncbi:beta-1,3-galactosyltransferase 1-like [Hydractinia symbiolongicarpus]|uniref:beta-1,3-galactosyltransferase 1-like n=1 Tax=Hydractinia symbiolongicarpus TaxID=13093 RepID=UPI00254FADE0|nr:beta-1,3-galactosyltransferase 1-like [Hydractinia symbiolongicarpus]
MLHIITTMKYTIVTITLIFTAAIMLYIYTKDDVLPNRHPKPRSYSNANEQNHSLDAILKYIKRLVNRVKQIETKIEDVNDFNQYKQDRNSILKLLPQLTPNTYKSNFHVLVDNLNRDVVSERYKVIIMVSSNAPNFNRRQNIRELWANKKNWKNHMWKLFFVTGGSSDKETMEALYNETSSYKDTIIEDIPEDFYNLAKKVMIGFQWAHVNFKYDYILKCDDDVFVHVDNLLTSLKVYKEGTFFGQQMFGQRVEREGRYGVTKAEHFNDTYDPYCSGGGFVLSHDTISKIIPLFNWERPLRIDDAYIGELAFAAGVTAQEHAGFDMWNTACEYKEELIVSHPVKERDCMEKMQEEARKSSVLK